MKCTNRKNLYKSFPKDINLNKISTGCAPCLNETLQIHRKINNRSLNQIKTGEIKEIVNSLFKDKKIKEKI